MNKLKINNFIYNWRVAPYVFVLPFLLAFSIFWIYPLVSAILMSFQNMLPGQRSWVGLQNFARLFRDATFFTAVGNSFLYMGLTIVILIPFPMLYAILLDNQLIKMKGVFRTMLYVPALASITVAGIMFRMVFSEMPNSAANQVLTFFGGEPTGWLRQKGTAFFVLLILCCWRWTGVNMIYFISGLKGIDPGLYESADIDGANWWQKLWYVTIPLLKPTMVYVLTISVYAGLAMFLEVYMLMGNGGPRNICLTIVGYLYRRGIERNELGFASAIGVVLMLIALAINLTQLRLTGTLSRKKD